MRLQAICHPDGPTQLLLFMDNGQTFHGVGASQEEAELCLLDSLEIAGLLEVPIDRLSSHCRPEWCRLKIMPPSHTPAEKRKKKKKKRTPKK